MNTERLFLALWPDEAVRQQVAGYARKLHRSLEGRRLPPRNWHVTLHYLGPTVAKQRQIVEDIATQTSAPAFSLLLDQAGCWSQPRVAWLGSSRIPDALALLFARLRNALQAQGFALDRRPLRPHMTLMRKVRCPKGELPRPQAVPWRVDRFVLARSHTLPGGAEYEVLREWMLQ